VFSVLASPQFEGGGQTDSGKVDHRYRAGVARICESSALGINERSFDVALPPPMPRV
jgi:hypothetical protein